MSALIEELQHTLGAGSCIDAYRTGTVIGEPDLAVPGVGRHSPQRPSRRGARAVFGFPVRIGTALRRITIEQAKGKISQAENVDMDRAFRDCVAVRAVTICVAPIWPATSPPA